MSETIKTKVQFKRLLLALLALVMLVTVTAFAASAATVVDSGTCGDNLTWSLDSDGVLTVSGTGEMWDWSYFEAPSWESKSDSIKSIIIGNGITTIGDFAFYGCKALTSFTISNSVITIGDYALFGCKALTSVTIPNSVTTIEANSFSYCTALKSVAISNSVTTIKGYAFYGCEALTSVTIPNRVTIIDEYVFTNCTSLRSVTIPNSVTTIGYYSFSGCEALTSITIPDGVIDIGWSAFSGCRALTSVTIPDSVTYIGGYAFANTALYNNSSNWTGDCLYIRKYLIAAKKSISGAYSIANGTKYIAGDAFSECAELKSVIIPNSVTTIGESAFYNCTALKSITIPDSVTAIEYGAFEGCEALTSVTIPNSVTVIGDSAFYDCTSLTTVNISDGVTSIGASAFYDTALYNNSSNWTGDCLYIGKYLIEAKESISGAYSIANGTKCIGGSAFFNCIALTSVTIPDSVITIGDEAFYNCTALTTVNNGNGVTSIGWDAFYNTALYNNSSNWNGDCLYIGNYLIEAKESISGACSIVNGTKCIADEAFYGCEALTSVTIPNSVTAIGGYTFSNCEKLTSITVPNSVTAIGWYAFEGCNSLKDVYYQGDSSGWSNISFANVYSNPCCYGASLHYSGELVSTVTGLKVATYNTTYLKLTWTNISGVTGYRVFKYNPTTKKYESYKNSSSNSLTVTGLKAGTQYYFKVRAYKSVSGKVYWGDYSSFLKTATIPPTVTGLKVASYGNTALKLTWTNISGVTGYKVYKYNPTTKKYESYKNSSSNSLTVTGLKAGTQYYFKVRAYKSISGRNYWGNYSSYLKTATRPLNAKISSVSSPSSGKLTATWGKVSGATGYYVQYSTNSRFSGAKAKYVNTNYINLTGLTRGTTYYVRVRPFVQIGSARIYSPALSAYKYVKIR